MTSELRHIVAIGGGGFSSDEQRLDDFVLSLSRRHPARVCFVSTASAESAAYIVKFYRAFRGRCLPTDVTLFDTPLLPRQPARTADLATFIAEQDVIYVGGGNTASMLAVWRTHGVDVLLREAWQRGTIMSGVSAGMLCWFAGGITDSYGGIDALDEGVGLIDAVASPHYDADGRRARLHAMVAGSGRQGFGVDDGVALHFAGTTLVDVVGSNGGAGAYRVESTPGGVAETPLAVRLLV